MTLGVRAACFVTLALYLAFLFLQVVTVHDGMDPAGSPVGYDFSAYYEAAQFARRGEPARAYDDQAIFAAEQARFPSSTTKLPWNYPPIFQAYLVPWTFLPYVTAFLSWTALMLAAYVAFTRHVVAAPALWPLLLFPGAIINLFLGANGLLVALLVGAGFLLIDRRPLLSGALFGLAVFKPHLTLFLPVALLAARKYRVLAGMLGTVVVLVSGTALLFGADAWLAFLAKAVHAGDVATSSSSGWTRVPTLYTLARVLGAGKIIAGVVHGAVAIMAAGGVAWLWRSSARPALRNGALALALLIITPYARIYDFAFLLFPILALMSETKELAPREDRLLIALAWAAPLIGLVVRISTPWLSILLIVLLARLMVKAMREMRVTPLDASS